MKNFRVHTKRNTQILLFTQKYRLPNNLLLLKSVLTFALPHWVNDIEVNGKDDCCTDNATKFANQTYDKH